MELITLFDVIGVLGACGYLLSYAILQLKREFAESIIYSLANFMAAFLVSISLIYDFNLASMIIQIFWMIISGYGVYKCLKYKLQQSARAHATDVYTLSEETESIELIKRL